MTALPVERFDTLGLADLTAGAELLTRVDRKYVLSPDQAAALLDGLDARTLVLAIDGRRRFQYESVYFDTPDLLSYRQSALRRRRRSKVRTRSYLDTGGAFLEVKTRDSRGTTVKDRTPYDPSDRDRLTPAALGFIDQTLAARGHAALAAAELTPTLVTRYRRLTLLPPESGVRVTVDTDLVWNYRRNALAVPGLVILETKSGSRPCDVDRLLWRAGHRPAAISKYGTGLAALRGDLPDNKWTRVLKSHFQIASKEIPCAA